MKKALQWILFPGTVTDLQPAWYLESDWLDKAAIFIQGKEKNSFPAYWSDFPRIFLPTGRTNQLRFILRFCKFVPLHSLMRQKVMKWSVISSSFIAFFFSHHLFRLASVSFKRQCVGSNPFSDISEKKVKTILTVLINQFLQRQFYINIY